MLKVTNSRSWWIVLPVSSLPLSASDTGKRGTVCV